MKKVIIFFKKNYTFAAFSDRSNSICSSIIYYNNFNKQRTTLINLMFKYLLSTFRCRFDLRQLVTFATFEFGAQFGGTSLAICCDSLLFCFRLLFVDCRCCWLSNELGLLSRCLTCCALLACCRRRSSRCRCCSARRISISAFIYINKKLTKTNRVVQNFFCTLSISARRFAIAAAPS